MVSDTSPSTDVLIACCICLATVFIPNCRLFLARESSVQGGFVISYYFGSRVYHVPVMPQTNPTTSAVTYSLDEGKTKFFDLLQCVEFYQLNKGSLNCKLTHYVVSRSGGGTGGLSARSESPTDSASSYCKNASDVSIDSKEPDPNHNSKKSKKMASSQENCSSEDEHSVATAVDANMASEESEADDSASMKIEEHWGQRTSWFLESYKKVVVFLTKITEHPIANLLLYQRPPNPPLSLLWPPRPPF